MKKYLFKNAVSLFFFLVLIVNVGFAQANNNVKTINNAQKNEIQFQIKGAKSDQGLITIKNDSGKIVLQEEMELNPKTSYFTFNTKGFKVGKYTMNISSTSDKISTDFLIK